jgi:hypothetical protein
MAQEKEPLARDEQPPSKGIGERPRTAEDQAAGGATHGDSAVGRENPADGTADADEALGNRVGGYGRGAED